MLRTFLYYVDKVMYKVFNGMCIGLGIYITWCIFG